MLGSIPATSSLGSNAEGVVLLLLLTIVYVACMFFVFCWPLVLAALGNTSLSSFIPEIALLFPLNMSISTSEAPPTLLRAFKNTLICARCSSITFKYACSGLSQHGFEHNSRTQCFQVFRVHTCICKPACSSFACSSPILLAAASTTRGCSACVSMSDTRAFSSAFFFLSSTTTFLLSLSALAAWTDSFSCAF
jgi:hypothetical protein